ncbi:MAG: L,D-transpeptidase family protein [Pseudomonadota bacterium]
MGKFHSFVVAAAALLLTAGCAQQQAAAPVAPAAQAEPVAFAQQALPPYDAALARHPVSAEIPSKGKAILVNIPSYELIAFEDGRPVLHSRVIVGRDLRGDRTPVMTARTSVVRFRPSWRPTPMMLRTGKYEDRIWPPGRGNPLGLLAIRLDPGMLIYLHGTNRPDLFDREARALSGGCIRVERWDEVAAWVLDVDLEDVHRSANGRRTFDMGTEGVPVLFRYYTEFPDRNGVLRRHSDVYGKRPALSAAATPAPTSSASSAATTGARTTGAAAEAPAG